MLVSKDATFLGKKFLQGGDIRKRVELEEVSYEPQFKPIEETNLEPIGPSSIIPHKAHRFSRVSHPSE